MKRYYFDLAAKIANNNDGRTFNLGAVGIRSDGVIVCARNGKSFSTKTEYFIKNIKSHAEGRVIRKLNKNSIIYLTRIINDGYAIAKPCDGCSILIKAKKIKKVYYTIDNYTYGVWDVSNDFHCISNF